MAAFTRPNSGHRNYETSICLVAFHAATQDHRYDKLISGARDFLKKLQWDDTEQVKPDMTCGFGGMRRVWWIAASGPLSNTSFLLDGSRRRESALDAIRP